MNKYLNPFKYYRFIQDISLFVMKRSFNFNKTNSPKIFLFGVPLHNNLGDQAITYSELDFIKKNVSNYDIVIIFEDFYEEVIPKIKRKINDNDIIAIPGGGNMGDTWIKYERERQYIVNSFKNYHNRIISFPQSYNFSDSKKGLSLKNQSNDIYSNHDNLHIYARENLSLEKMIGNFNTKEPIRLVPDIVLRLDERVDSTHREGIMTIMRGDREKQSDNKKMNLISYLNDNYGDLKKSDTVTDYIPNIISNKTRNKLLKKKWLEFSESKLVITDRLHGMIFAYITGTPAIVFDNSNHKVFYSYENWLKKADYIHYANDYSHNGLINLINKYMSYDDFMGKKIFTDDDSEYYDLIKSFDVSSLVEITTSDR